MAKKATTKAGASLQEMRKRRKAERATPGFDPAKPNPAKLPSAGVSRVGVGRPTTTRINLPTASSPRASEERVRLQNQRKASTRSQIGIRPGQFGEIDEAAGERVVFEPVDRLKPELGEKAVVRNAEGAFIRDAGEITSPQEISLNQRKEAGAAVSPESGAMGKPGATGFSGLTDTGESLGVKKDRISDQDALSARLAEIDAQEEAELKRGKTSANPQMVQENARANATRLRQEARDELKTSQEEEKTNAEIAASKAQEEAARSQTREFTVPTPQSTGMSAALANLAKDSPEAQALLPFIQDYQNSISDQMAQNRAFTEQLVGKTQEDFQTTQDAFGMLQSKYEESTKAIQSLLEEAKEDSNEQIAREAASADAQLKWAEQKEKNRLAKAKAAQHSALVVQLALEGGFGQPSALRQIDESDNYFDEKFSELTQTYAFKRTDLAAQFGALYQENKQNYISNTVANIKDNMATIERLSLKGIENKQLEDQQINNILTTMFAKQSELATKSAEANYKFANDIQDIINEERKAKIGDVIKTGDSINFISETSKELNGRQIIKDAAQIDTRAKIMQRAADEWFAGNTESAVAVDQALITMFNKMTDPSSVVRESEYLRTSSDLSLFDRIKGMGAKEFITGGAGLTDEVRRDLVNMGKAFKEEYDRKLDQTLQPYIARVNMFNSQPGVQTPVKLTDLIPSSMIPQVSQAKLDMWGIQMTGRNVTLGSNDIVPDFSTQEGLRVDRHSNPTALQWTPRLQEWFNSRGYEVSKGDQFPDNPSAFTLDMNDVDDPVQATIDYIDNHSFYYKNSPRWSHTSMDRSSWDAMAYNEKQEVVIQMAKREKTTGLLANGYTLKGAAEGGVYTGLNLVPTASAAEPTQQSKISSILPNPTSEEVQKIAQAPEGQEHRIASLLASVRQGRIAKQEADQEIANLTGTTASIGRGLRSGAEFVGNKPLRYAGETIVEGAKTAGDIGGKIFNATGDVLSSFYR